MQDPHGPGRQVEHIDRLDHVAEVAQPNVAEAVGAEVLGPRGLDQHRQGAAGEDHRGNGARKQRDHPIHGAPPRLMPVPLARISLRSRTHLPHRREHPSWTPSHVGRCAHDTPWSERPDSPDQRPGTPASVTGSLGTGCTVVSSAPAGRIRCGRFVGAGRVEVMAVSRRVQTLLFTDIVGSTDRLRELGDAAWARLLARYHACDPSRAGGAWWPGGGHRRGRVPGPVRRPGLGGAGGGGRGGGGGAVADRDPCRAAHRRGGARRRGGDRGRGAPGGKGDGPSRSRAGAGQCHGPRAHGGKRAGVRRSGSARAQGVRRALAAVRPRPGHGAGR